MKDSDKVTLTVAQLKKLVKESKHIYEDDNEEKEKPIDCLNSALSFFVQVNDPEFEEMFINELTNMFCDNGGIKGSIKDRLDDPTPEEVDSMMNELLKQFGSEENIRKYVKKYILDYYRHNNKYLFTDEDSRYIDSDLTFD